MYDRYLMDEADILNIRHKLLLYWRSHDHTHLTGVLPTRCLLCGTRL